MNTTENRWLKCDCIHCSGSIEFETDHLDEMVTCPHCGQDTILHRPKARTRTAQDILVEMDLAARRKRLEKKRLLYARLKWPIIVGLGLGFLCLAAVLLNTLLSHKEVSAYLADIPSALIIAAIIVGGVGLTVLWILFPVTVYVYLRRLVAEQRKTNDLLRSVLDK